MSSPGAEVANVARHISRVTRSLYFMPPDFGAALVAEVLGDPELRRQWIAELEGMRCRIVSQRSALRRALEEELPMSFSAMTTQKGMFSLTGLSLDEINAIGRQDAIYLMPDGRMNIAAIPEGEIGRVAASLARAINARQILPDRARQSPRR